MCSAHHLIKRNIRVKFHENRSKAQKIWSGHESVKDGLTDERRSYKPLFHFMAGD